MPSNYPEKMGRKSTFYQRPLTEGETKSRQNRNNDLNLHRFGFVDAVCLLSGPLR